MQKELRDFIVKAKEESMSVEIRGRNLIVTLINIKKDNIKIVIFINNEESKELQRELYNKWMALQIEKAHL